MGGRGTQQTAPRSALHTSPRPAGSAAIPPYKLILKAFWVIDLIAGSCQAGIFDEQGKAHHEVMVIDIHLLHDMYCCYTFLLAECKPSACCIDDDVVLETLLEPRKESDVSKAGMDQGMKCTDTKIGSACAAAI